jgi:dipeptidyl-peptidase-2/lysosomal Pro-X carboxypeptidase
MFSKIGFLAASFLFSGALGKSGNDCSPATKFFEQNVDHYGPRYQLFPQQYQILDTYFKPGGPILFYQGGETADMICLEDLILPTWAKELGALAVTLEHRFFGKSNPNNFENLTVRYDTLTLDNVLEDSVNFITWIKENVNGARDSPVIATGGKFHSPQILKSSNNYDFPVQGRMPVI